MLQCGAALFGLPRPLWASPEGGFHDLAGPVTVALTDVSEPWQSVEFDAWTVDATGNDLLLKGLLVRTRRTDQPAEGLAAYCLACPHEFCYVGLVEASDAAELELEAPGHPLFVCACHFSAFDPAGDGARLGGPTPRGLYRFRIEVTDALVHVTQVEEAVIQFLS